MERTDRDFVNQLFRGLQAIFPAWRQAFDSDEAVAEAKRQWTIGLIEAGLTSADAIKAGLSRARRSKNPFIPSVGQFIGWCQEARKEVLGLPNEDSAYAQVKLYAIRSRGNLMPGEDPPVIHPAVYWAYQNIDDLHHWKTAAKVDEHREMFISKYRIAQEKALQGFEFPAPPVLLRDYSDVMRPVTPEDRERSKQILAEMKSLFGGAS